MEHKDLLAKSMELLEEAMSAAFTRPERMNPEKNRTNRPVRETNQ